MHREILFYNGFNLLIDIIIGLSVWFFTYKHAWMRGYEDASADSMNAFEQYVVDWQRENE